MALTLVFMGRLEDAAGEAERKVIHAASLAQVYAGLEGALVAALADPRVRIAINGALVGDPAMAVLADGDEIAFLPPVSGG